MFNDLWLYINRIPVEMEAENGSRNLSDEELTRLAVEKILEETKMASMRAERVGTFGWQPSQKSAVNKKFLQHTLLFNALHNKRKEMAKLRKSTPSSSSKSS